MQTYFEVDATANVQTYFEVNAINHFIDYIAFEPTQGFSNVESSLQMRVGNSNCQLQVNDVENYSNIFGIWK